MTEHSEHQLPDLNGLMGKAMADDAYFLDALANLGEALPLVASEAIYDRDGAKVLDTGAKIDRVVYLSIASRILAKPLADSVSVSPEVDGEALLEEAVSAMDAEPFYHALVSRTGEREAIRELFRGLLLPKQVALRLTMARTTFPALFRSCVRQGIMCIYFARRLEWPQQRVKMAAMTGICLDLGMLHVDPELIVARRRLTSQERRHIFAHPLIGMVCAMEAGIDAEACEAIGQHHERLDGSGYPLGIGSDSSMLSRIAQIASCGEGLLARSKGSQCEGFHLALRLSMGQFDQSLAAWAMEPMSLAMGSQIKSTVVPVPIKEETAERLRIALSNIEQVFNLTDLWKGSVEAAIEAGAPKEMIDPLYEMDRRMVEIGRSLSRAGIFKEQLSVLWDMDNPEEEEALELSRISSEVVFQLSNLGANMARRWPWLTEDPCFTEAKACLSDMQSIGSY